MASGFEAVPKRKHINVFKIGNLWVFKHFFGDRGLFRALQDHYNKDLYRFEFRTVGERNAALKLLDRNGFDCSIVEDLQGYVVKLPKSARYAQILKNSVAQSETSRERMFLMKNLAAVEEAVSLGAELFDGEVVF